MTNATSARNQIPGTVTAIRKGAVNAEIEVAIAGGGTLVAQVTLPSVESLALASGKPVTVLLKSSWLLLGVGEAEPRVSARNRLKAKVVSVTAGAVNAEVALQLDGGQKMVATVTNQSVEALGLVPGATAWALFKASAPILSV